MGFRTRALLLCGLAVVAASSGQPLQVGSLPEGANVPMAPAPVTVFDFQGSPAAGTLDSVVFAYSVFPCPAAVKIKFFRTFGVAMRLLAERGPFDVNEAIQTVPLSPPVTVLTHDFVAITRLTNCGSPLAAPTGTGTLASFPGDVSTDTIIQASNLASGLTLALQASGTRVPFDGVTSVIPVAYGGLGAFGATFHTDARLYNPADGSISGWLLVRPRGSLSNQSFIPYSLEPHQVKSVELNFGFFSSIDIIPISGAGARASVRVYGDLGSAGTFGFSTTDVLVADALAAGESGVLFGPADPSDFRMNIGFRGIPLANFLITVRDQDGAIVTTRSQLAGISIQAPAQDLVGVPLQPNMTITFEVVSGTAVVYGVTADNRTNDTDFQLARRLP